jgi:hypothetical protein
MSATATDVLAHVPTGSLPALEKLALVAPRPVTLEASGVPVQVLADLVLKFISRLGPLSASTLCDRIALVHSALEPVFLLLRREGCVDLQARGGTEMCLVLSARGRDAAAEAWLRSGYLGPAPVPLAVYDRVVRTQSVHLGRCTRRSMQTAFEDVVLEDDLRDRLGVALNSGRAIFLHGQAGAGKTFVAARLIRALPGEVLIPHAILVDGTVIRVFDAAVHEVLELTKANPRLLHGRGFDARFVLCERPFITSGGEMVPEMLDVQYNAATREFAAPLQMKANNGLLLVDDLGRQRFPVETLFNRWILPMEQQLDYLTAAAGLHFGVPFDLVLVFSTNLNPAELADDAVLRRLGYKIEFKPLPVELYKQVWSDASRELRLSYDPDLVEYVINDLYPGSGHALLACHPRDLLRMARDKSIFEGTDDVIGPEDLRWCWSNYFLNAAKPSTATGD